MSLACRVCSAPWVARARRPLASPLRFRIGGQRFQGRGPPSEPCGPRAVPNPGAPRQGGPSTGACVRRSDPKAARACKPTFALRAGPCPTTQVRQGAASLWRPPAPVDETPAPGQVFVPRPCGPACVGAQGRQGNAPSWPCRRCLRGAAGAKTKRCLMLARARSFFGAPGDVTATRLFYLRLCLLIRSCVRRAKARRPPASDANLAADVGALLMFFRLLCGPGAGKARGQPPAEGGADIVTSKEGKVLRLGPPVGSAASRGVCNGKSHPRTMRYQRPHGQGVQRQGRAVRNT